MATSRKAGSMPTVSKGRTVKAEVLNLEAQAPVVDTTPAATNPLPAPTVTYDRCIVAFSRTLETTLKAFEGWTMESADDHILLRKDGETVKVIVSELACVFTDTYDLPDGRKLAFHLAIKPESEQELLDNGAITIMARKRPPTDKEDAKAAREEFWDAVEPYAADFSWIVPEEFAQMACLLRGMTPAKAASLAKRAEGVSKSDIMEAIKRHSMKYGKSRA